MAVGEMSSVVKRHSHNFSALRNKREVDRDIRRRTGKRLNIDRSFIFA